MREHGEYFYENACDSLKGSVCYRSDGGWGFGDYLSGAKGALSSCLKKAKKSAVSWKNTELEQEYITIETEVKEVFQRTQVEQWGINAMVHYNNWANLGKDDFRPIIEAFHDLENQFLCSHCNGIISLIMDGVTEKSVKCPCGKINWNLEVQKQ